jgi:hypothetical protein
VMRQIQPIPLPIDITPAPVPGAPPVLILVSPLALHIDGRYQRDLSERSVKLIHKMVAGWSWAKFKPPIVALRDGTSDAEGNAAYDVLDGQHTALGAATHGGIPLIPVMLAPAATMQERAQAFISHNRDRVIMQAAQLLFADAAAGDEDAQTVLQVCQRAGVTILKLPPAAGRYKEGQTMAVAVIKRIINQRGAMKARIALEACAQARAAPISADMIKAADELLNGRDYAGEIEPGALALSLMKIGEHEARIAEMAAAKKLPRWRAMTVVLYQTTRRKRAA